MDAPDPRSFPNSPAIDCWTIWFNCRQGHQWDDLCKSDSIDVFELIMELEDTFSVQFEDSRIEALKNVGDVVTYIDQLTP